MVSIKYLNKKSRQSIIRVLSLDLYFEDETLVAFNHPTTGLVVSQNKWGKKTEKFLCSLLSTEKHTDHNAFRKTLNQLLNTMREE